MTLQSPPAYLQAGTYSALSDRLHLNTIRTHKDPTDPFRTYGGFFADRFPTYSNPSGMNWAIGPCAGIVQNTFASGSGDYAFANPTNVTGSFAASSPTQNRNDILGFRVRDNFYDASGFNDIIPAVVQGTNSSGTPVDPALPPSFIPVLRAVINAAATTPVLQDLRGRTTPTGAVLPVDSATARSLLGSPHAGFSIWRTDTQAFEVADGAGSWRVINPLVVASSAALSSAVSSPYVGQQAYRTDGAQLYFRDSDALWKPSKVLAARRLVGSGTQYTITGSTETAMAKFSITKNVVSGRWYRLTLAIFLQAPGTPPNSMVFRVRRNSSPGGTFITEWLFVAEQNAAFDNDFTGTRLWKAAATESITFVVGGLVAAGTGSIKVRGGTGSSGEAMFWIEDVGSDPDLTDVP